MAKLSALESLARDRIELSRLRDSDANAGKGHSRWSVRQTIRNVFTAMYANELSAETVAKMGAVMSGFLDTPEWQEGIRKELTVLTREKLLYSARDRGQQKYGLQLDK